MIAVARENGLAVRALPRGGRPPEDGFAWIEGTLADPAALATLCEGADAVIHIAGLINAARRESFEAVNVGGTAAMIEAARAAGVRRFVHISSLAAREPELSDYGWSKAQSERVVAASGLDWTIVRPPAVYGPGDRETFELFKMARRGFVALPPPGRFSLLHVDDLARLILAVVAAPESHGETYEPDDGAERADQRIRRTLAPVRAPTTRWRSRIGPEGAAGSIAWSAAKGQADPDRAAISATDWW